MNETAATTCANNKGPEEEEEPFSKLATDEEKVQWMMAEYQALSVVHDKDGLDFAGKTAMWVAYERFLESSQNMPLFCDPLAQTFAGEYGKRLSTAMKVGLKVVFDPPNSNQDDDGDDIGLGYQGHVAYTAARTKLINDCLATWLDNDNNPAQLQVVNLGSGMDSRVFWLEALKNAALYVEVDTAPVLRVKSQMEHELAVQGQLPEPLCPRSIVELNLCQESLHGTLPQKCPSFQPETATVWILEGLVMYLSQECVDQLLDGLSQLSSAVGSFAVINFSTQSPAADPDHIDKRMLANGWERVNKLYFGEEAFNFGRYPAGKPANTSLGFCMYRLQIE